MALSRCESQVSISRGFQPAYRKGKLSSPDLLYLRGDDWQTPYVIAEKYFEEIEAPNKGLYIIPGAGHMTMMDQPALFFDTLREINKGNHH